MNGALHIIFDGPPAPDGPRFVEVEDDAGKSINAGEWSKRADGYWVLKCDRIAAPKRTIPGMEDVLAEIVGDLASAIHQSLPTDDEIIMNYVRTAHARARTLLTFIRAMGGVSGVAQ
jgi:hypothetical protein